MNYYEYNADGRIIVHHSRPDSAPPPDPTVGNAVIVVAELLPDMYVDLAGPTAEPKTSLGASWSKTMVTANGTDEAVLSPLPVPCTVYVDNNQYIIDDGSFEFSADTAGDYEITVNEVSYLPENWVITAT